MDPDPVFRMLLLILRSEFKPFASREMEPSADTIETPFVIDPFVVLKDTVPLPDEVIVPVLAVVIAPSDDNVMALPVPREPVPFPVPTTELKAAFTVIA
jgi:hypothetical protein